MEEVDKNQKGQEHNVVNKSVDTVDRISQLPQDIIHAILSFLPTKDAAKTSILSKTWLHWWSSFPNFDFDEEDFYWYYPDGFHIGRYTIPRFMKEEFMNFINNTLQRCLEQNLSINKFRLHVTSQNLEKDPHIDRWVSIAMERNAKELDLTFEVRRYAYYNLPQTVFDSTTITVLKLCGCTLKSYRDIKFSHLQKLFLKSVYIDEQILDNLTSSCPSIEDFRLKFCHTLKYLEVSRLLHLNRIEVYNCRGLEQIKIGTPSLQTFQCDEGAIDSQCKIDFKACEILKELKFRDVNIKNLDQLLQDLSSKFPNLEVLILNKCRGLDNIDISGQKLKRLVLRHLDLAVAKIDTPNLIALEYVDNRMGSFSIHTPKLREVELEFKNGAYLDNRGLADYHRVYGYWVEYPHWYDELKVLLGKFANFNGLKLVIQFNKFVIIHEDLKGITIPPQENFKNLKVFIKITSMNLSDLMEKLSLGFTLHAISIVSLSDSKLLKILYEEPRYSFVKPVRHVSLEEIESFDEVEDDHGVTLLKLYEKMQYKTTTFRVRYRRKA